MEVNMDRRDFLKFSFGGLVLSTIASNELFAEISKSKFPKGKGVIFVVGDGFPLGVMKMYDEYIKRRFNEKSNFAYLLNSSKTRIYLQNTSSLSSVVTDSAPASVAWGTGSKTVNRSLSSLPDWRQLTTIFEIAKHNGMSCGVVTTTRITHATPAAWYSHNSNRDEEDSIADDLLSANLDIALGGGDKHFNHKTRKDGKDLYEQFRQKGYNVVNKKEDLLNIKDFSRPILGVFNKSHISYFVDRINDKSLGDVQPTLFEMTAVALKRLMMNPKGFILQIEAGRIDHACHANDAYGAMMDCYELDKTIGELIALAEKNPNILLIITSDHGNSGFGINGSGPEYNDSTEGLMAYNNKASFEYMIKQMKKQDVKTVKDIFENYTGQKITDEEANDIFNKLNNKREIILNDIWYEPDATMGRILMASAYRSQGGEYGIIKPAVVRRGNVGFTGTNHTGEDQLVMIYGSNLNGIDLRVRIDNTDLFKVMTKYLGIKFENPKMTEDEAKSFIKTASMEEWLNHLKLHIS